MGGPMNDLIERIEAASGPDRELDCRILCAINNWTFRKVLHRSPNVQHISFRCSDGDKGLYNTPRFSASIDAALTLVPEGFEWCLAYQAGHHVSSDVECMIAIAKLGDPCRDWESESYTPALALCAAALKARAYLKETNNAD